MKTRHCSRLGALVLLLALAVGAVNPGGGAVRAQDGYRYLFSPVTLDDFGPSSDSGPFAAVAGVSGDWVAETVASLGCGHCGTYVHTLLVHNVISGQKASIRVATFEPNADGYRLAAAGVQLAGSYLVWHQPAQPAGTPRPGQGPFTPGDFDCALCVYNVLTGQGGTVSGLQTLDPTGQGRVLPLA